MAMLILVGCRANMQSDLIERELRWQEDQIYALEDYLMEYQAKVRRLRSENASLAQELAMHQAASQTPSTSSARRSPAEVPRRRNSDGGLGNHEGEEPEPTPVLEPTEAEEDEIPLDSTEVPVPQVPPLPTPANPDSRLDMEMDSGTSQTDHRAQWITENPRGEPGKRMAPPINWIGAPSSASLVSAASVDKSNSAAADGNEIVFHQQLSASTGDSASPAPADEVLPSTWLGDVGVPLASYRPTSVLMEADMLPSDTPDVRFLQASLSPLTDDHEPAYYEGSVSFMLRDPALPIPESTLARWDYDSDAVNEAWTVSSRGRLLRFSLPLPPDPPSVADLELWVRMVPLNGGRAAKILDHMTLQLSEMNLSKPIELGSDWAVARPGLPALLPAEKQSATHWRTATARPSSASWLE